MKKFISLALCIVMMFSVFSVCSVAAENDTFNAFSVKATDVVDGKVTYNIYLEPNVYVLSAIINIVYDENVLEPILPDIFVDEKNGKEYPILENEGAFMITDKYGDETQSIPGVYASGMVDNKTNVLSVAYINIKSYASTTRKGFFTIPFKVIDSDRPVTDVKFYCVDYKYSDGENDVMKEPTLFKTVSTDTFEKTIITGVTPVANGMQIKWKATEGADKYVVYKAKDSGGWENINNNVSANATSYVDESARHGVKETYAVRAFKKDANNKFYSFKTYNTVTGLYVAPVSKVSTANSGDGVKISWSAVSGASGYRVFKRVTNADGTKTAWMTLVSNTTAKSYVDKNVANDVKYEYIVRAYIGKVFSAKSGASAIYHYDAPTVKIASVKGGAKITWNAIESAETYKIYRRNNGTSAWTALKTVTADELSYIDAGATSGKKLDYTVRAYSSKGNSNYIAKTINYVATPKLTSLTNGTSGAVLKWGAVKGATSYRVYRKVAGEKSWTTLATVKTTSYTDKTAKSGTKYFYTVKAFNGNVASGYDTTGITLKYLVMPKITKLTNTTTGINVKWSATTGAASYRVYRKATGESGWKNIGTVKTISFTDKNVTNGKTYTYTVRAVDGSNLSAYNNTGTSIKRVK